MRQFRDLYPRPDVETCRYDRSIQQWDAILSNGSHLYVMVVRGNKDYKRFFFSLRICLHRIPVARSFRPMSAAVPWTAGRGGRVE